MSQNNSGRIGVLLLNLGGPDSLAAVRPFLYNLFSDREIIRLGPALLQKPLAYLISLLRSGKTRDAYGLIGGRSPIREITEAQAAALEAALAGAGREFVVRVGMRYWVPSTADAVAALLRGGCSRIVALSLYPHYSVATTGSSERELKRVISGLPVATVSVQPWYADRLYIDALVEKVKEGLAACGDRTPHLLFSAHSLPKKFIDEGDPYLEHVRETIRAVTEKINADWSLSFQSKSGPVEWLAPSTDEMLRSLAQKGLKDLLVVPISFVSDHIETLYEIDILYKKMAESLSMTLRRTESLNTSPLFIEALKGLVLGRAERAGWLT